MQIDTLHADQNNISDEAKAAARVLWGRQRLVSRKRGLEIMLVESTGWWHGGGNDADLLIKVSSSPDSPDRLRAPDDVIILEFKSLVESKSGRTNSCTDSESCWRTSVDGCHIDLTWCCLRRA